MKYAIVTGASGGMGSATITKLLKLGYTVFAFDIKDIEKKPRLIFVNVDLTNEESVKHAYHYVKQHTNRIDVIIHFAGIYELDSLIEISEERFKKIFEINLYGAYLINKTFIPLLQNGSRIIMTTSELAVLDPLLFTGIYAITKAALDKYAYSLRMELQLLGIKVSVLRAGAVSTRMLDVSNKELDTFVSNTALYSCNADRFKKIVNSVEAKQISCDKLASKVIKILNKKNPCFAYTINRNLYLLLLNKLPKRMQFAIIKKILK